MTVRNLFGEARYLNDRSLMGALANYLFADPGFHTKLGAPAIHGCQLREDGQLRPDWRGGAVPNIYVRPNRVMPRIEHGQNQVAAGPLHGENHLRSGKDARAFIAQESNRAVVTDFDNFLAPRADLVVSHSFCTDSSFGPLVAQ